jgi:hypothetical protein
VLWWLSYINCFFRFIGAALVGRVGMISSFPASPAQFNQLKHWLNVICAKISKNLIFAENRFFFCKKKVHQKKLRAPPIYSGNKIRKFYYQSNFLNFISGSNGSFQEPPACGVT